MHQVGCTKKDQVCWIFVLLLAQYEGWLPQSSTSADKLRQMPNPYQASGFASPDRPSPAAFLPLNGLLLETAQHHGANDWAVQCLGAFGTHRFTHGFPL